MLVLHEMFGLNDDIRRICGRLAREGYAALAPSLYSSGNRLLCLTRLLTAGVLDGSERRILEGIGASHRALADHPSVDAERVAVIGFCMGGGFALTYAARGGLKAASINYGQVPRDKSKLEGICPVVASYGGLDRLFAPQGERLREHLEVLGVPHDVKVYEGVGHSFLNKDSGPAWVARLPSPMHVGYSEAEAEDAWRRILAFFSEHVSATNEK